MKTLQGLPDNTAYPVMLNLAGSVGACPQTCDSSRTDNLPVLQTVQTASRPPKAPTPQIPRLQTASTPQPTPRTHIAPPSLRPQTASTPPAAPRPQEATTAEQGPEQHILTHWEDHQVKALLGIIKDKDKDLLVKGKNKKAIWKSISEELSSNLGVTITSDQCYDKFRNIKQPLRKHEDRRRKTGNGQPKPFKYPDIYDIVGDDPTLKPTYTCDSEGNICDRSEVSSDSDGEENPPPPPKKMKSRSRSSLVANEMKEMYKESQKQLQETLLTMHNQNRELLTRLIDKL